MNHHDYYAAAAQVIPILFFVAILERRAVQVSLYRWKWLTAVESVFLTGAIVFFICGEFAALHGLDHQLGKGGHTVVTFTLIYLLAIIGLLGVGAVLKPLGDRILEAQARPRPDPAHPNEFRGKWSRPR